MSVPQIDPSSDQTGLPSPAELRARFPLTARAARRIAEARDAIRDILHGRDRERLLVVAGPCSIHDPASALEYGRALAKLAHDSADALVVVMRSYFDKPRTTHGWKGLIRDPWLDGSGDLACGLPLARRLLCELGELGLACGSELLDPFTSSCFEDLFAWGVIGARTTESQTHRELAGSLGMPIGFKNGMRGELEIARDAMIAAREPEAFVTLDADGRACVMRSAGNPDTHLVLRGGKRPNYSPRNVQRALDLLADQPAARPVLVDCSHGNSGKDPSRQPQVARSVLAQYAGGRSEIMGLMLESHLRPGRQDLEAGRPLEYGVSITDACLGWDETEQLLYEAAALVRARRGER